jgi:UDP-glucose 4-epimerase
MGHDETVVVLGGLGFMGSHLCRRLLKDGYKVRIFDKGSTGQTLTEEFPGQVDVFEGNIARPDDVVKAIGNGTTVVNLIHTTVPGSSMADPVYDISSNVAATVGWLRLLDKTNVRRILYVSSGGTVYGLPESLPITETHPTNPICSYGITKLAIEKYTAMFADMFGIDYLILRPSNVYGPGQRLNVGQGVIGILARRALDGQPLEVWGTGSNLRDYLFIDDLTEAITALIVYEGQERVFNVSSGVGHSVVQIISVLEQHIQPFPMVTHFPERTFDTTINILDPSRIYAEIGWRPAIDLETGTLRAIEWLQSVEPRSINSH